MPKIVAVSLGERFDKIPYDADLPDEERVDWGTTPLTSRQRERLANLQQRTRTVGKKRLQQVTDHTWGTFRHEVVSAGLTSCKNFKDTEGLELTVPALPRNRDPRPDERREMDVFMTRVPEEAMADLFLLIWNRERLNEDLEGESDLQSASA